MGTEGLPSATVFTCPSVTPRKEKAPEYRIFEFGKYLAAVF